MTPRVDFSAGLVYTDSQEKTPTIPKSGNCSGYSPEQCHSPGKGRDGGFEGGKDNCEA